MNTRSSSILAIGGILAGVIIYTTACDDSSTVKEPTGTSSSSSGNQGSTTSSSGDPNNLDAGMLPDGAPKDCFDNPVSHFQLINACTNADRVDRKPTLQKLLADGGLPPLQ